MKPVDVIIIGAGITGICLAYELVKQGFSVLVLEEQPSLNNATTYSYGGLAYWSGTTPLTCQLCQEGIAIHRSLSSELETSTDFRETHLLLLVESGEDPTLYLANYSHFGVKPRLLTSQDSVELEPLLNPDAISGALVFPHGHINPHLTNLAYQQAFLRLGGLLKYAKALDLIGQDGQVTGVKTTQGNFYAPHTVVCAGTLTEVLLQHMGIEVPIYFTRERVIKTKTTELRLNNIVMPARFQRLELESLARQQTSLSKTIVDIGAVQFQNGTLLLGQASSVGPETDSSTDELAIRSGISSILPELADLPGIVHTCLVAFSDPVNPLVGQLPDWQGLHLFSGFTSTLIFAPPLARRFAQSLANAPLELFQLT